MGKKAVHFGAGNIGRGFVAEFLHKSGYEVVFADTVDKRAAQLNKVKSYTVTQVGAGGGTKSVVTNYRALNPNTHGADVAWEIASADLVTCAVGPGNLKDIAPIIARGIDARSSSLAPLAVIACENAIGATDVLASCIKCEQNTPPHRLGDHHWRARYANSAVDRIVPVQDEAAGLDVVLEKFHEWVVDRAPFNDRGAPQIQGVVWVDNLTPYIERKLFTVNTGHAVAAYLGYSLNKVTVLDAMQEEGVLAAVKKALSETGGLLVAKHGMDPGDHQAYVDRVIQRFLNPYLADSVKRVAGAPMRKLSRRDRLVAPAAELAMAGRDCSGLLYAAEMAFRFQDVEGDGESAELARILAARSARDVVLLVCGLEPEHPLFAMMVQVVQKVQSGAAAA